MKPNILTRRQRAVLATFGKDKKLAARFYLKSVLHYTTVRMEY